MTNEAGIKPGPQFFLFMIENEVALKVLIDALLPQGRARLVISAEDYETFASFEWELKRPNVLNKEGRILFKRSSS